MIQAFMNLSHLHKQFLQAQWSLEARLQTPVCLPGCGRCCTVKSCMIIEAINMNSVLTGEGRLKAAVAIAENWLLEREPVGANELALSYKGLPVGIVPSEIRQEREQVAKGRCPFLTDDLKCFIYNCRPMVCMAQGVTREIAVCPRPLGMGESSTRRMFASSGKLSSLVEEFKRDCGRMPEWRIYGFAPTLLYRTAEPDKFRAMVDDNRIPSAKIIGTEIDTNLMWQPQVQALKEGLSPDLIAAGITRRIDRN